MPRLSPFRKIRNLLGALSLDELRRLRDELGDLITLYEQGGALTGWGSIEEKMIRNFGPYIYVRRRMVDAAGRQRLANVGYYGRIEGGLTDAEKAGLLKAHNEGGERVGERYLASIGKPVTVRRWESKKAPKEQPVHPLGNGVKLSGRALAEHPIFKFLEQVAPAEAEVLRQETFAYHDDLRRYRDDQRQKRQFGPPLWRTSYPLAELKRRRFYERLKNRPRPHFRIWRGRRRDDDT